MLRYLATALAAYLSTLIIVVSGVLIGNRHMSLSGDAVARRDLIHAFANWDGRWYCRILENGYVYDPRKPSSVAFFPGYPLLGRVVSDVSASDSQTALLVISHLCLLGAFLTFAAYLRLPSNRTLETRHYIFVLLLF